MSIGVDCPCGYFIKNDGPGFESFLADFLPDQHSDPYCSALEAAIREHPGGTEIAVAHAIDQTVRLFRQVWQCPQCGRLLVLGPNYKYFSFTPEAPDTPRDVLSGALHDQTGKAIQMIP
jgi:hypothetical protein